MTKSQPRRVGVASFFRSLSFLSALGYIPIYPSMGKPERGNSHNRSGAGVRTQ